MSPGNSHRELCPSQSALKHPKHPGASETGLFNLEKRSSTFINRLFSTSFHHAATGTALSAVPVVWAHGRAGAPLIIVLGHTHIHGIQGSTPPGSAPAYSQWKAVAQGGFQASRRKNSPRHPFLQPFFQASKAPGTVPCRPGRRPFQQWKWCCHGICIQPAQGANHSAR